MSTKWNLLVRPPEGVCPEKYCFHWVTPGGYADMTGRRYASREEALRNAEWTPFPDGGCSCTLGLCKRFDPVNGSQDFYEPCEPRLEEDGLPWFYFCTLDSLSDRFHEKFIRESEQLWGPSMPRVLPPVMPEGTVWFGGPPYGAALCLRIYGDDLDPDEITRLMGHAPSRSQRKGQSVLDSSGRVKRVARTGSWLLDRSLDAEATIEEGIESLLDGLPDDEQMWAELRQRFQVDLLCDVFIRGVNQGFTVSPRVLGLLARRGIEFGVDIYSQPDHEQAAKLQERLGGGN